jgi:hypothetical protein
LAVLDTRQDPIYIVRRKRTQPVCAGLELFEHFRGRRDGRLGPGNVDLAVASGNAHAQRVADASQMLVAGAEKRQECFGTDDRYG